MTQPDERLFALIRSAGAPALGAAGVAAIAAALDTGPLVLVLGASFGATIPAALDLFSKPGPATSSAQDDASPAGDQLGNAGAMAPEDPDEARARAASLIAPDLDRRALLPGSPARPLSRSEAAAEPSESQRVLDHLPAGLMVLDEGGKVLIANRKAVDEIGRAPQGMALTLLLRAPQLLEALTTAYRDKTPTEVSFSMHGAQERTLFATLMPMTAPDGGARMIVLLQDQTRIRRAEQLHRDFVANASHELKTPLAAIGGFIETLRDAAKDDPEARERFLGIMAQQTERMRLLIVDLMSLNRIELNEHVAPRDRIALNDIVDTAVTHVMEATSAARASQGATAAAVHIDTETPDDSPIVHGDRSELTQALVNLIDNALKYGAGDRPPKVVVSVRDEDRPRVALTVQDFGDGIAREHIPRLTERFYRVGSDPAKGKTGTGLGLAIVKHVAARHRGELVVESRLGHGSQFTLLLPLAS